MTEVEAPPTLRSLTVAGEVALLGVTVAAVLSMARLFEAHTFLIPLGLSAIVGHGLAVAIRRARVPAGPATLLWIAPAPLLVGLLLYPETTIAGVPTMETWRAVSDDLSAAWSLFRDIRAPAPVEDGFLAIGVGAVVATAGIADWGAFRLRLTFEPVLPACVLFVFASMLGAPQHREVTTALFAFAVLSFVLLQRTIQNGAAARWPIADARRGSSSLLRVGGGLASAAVIAAVLVGPAIPGVDDPAVLAWREIGDTASSRVVTSPFVDIRRRLVDQAATEVFTVRTDTRSYWRLTSLDTFDGRIWSSSGKFKKASGGLPASQGESQAVTRLATQEFRIAALAQIWLPAAFEPRRIDSGEAEVRYEAESATLIVDTAHPTSDGLVYLVESQIPDYERDALAGATSAAVPDDISAAYLDLPADFSPTARAAAETVTQGALTPYEQARRLQDWFQNEFVYDLDADPGLTRDAVDEFLTSRRGYCQQFSGTFAAMARHLGLPTRVAVGFTPGEPNPDDPSLYRVRGEHAHAWPEVFIAGYGWVPFEPTPGRGVPGAEGYTGIPEQQAAPGQPSTATTLAPSQAAPTPTTTPGTGEQGTTPTTSRSDVGTAGGDDTAASTDRGAPWAGRLRSAAMVLGAAVVVAAAYAAIALGVHRRRRARLVRATGPGAARAEAIWASAVDTVAPLGAAPMLAETHAEFAVRVADHCELPVDGLARLAAIAAEAAYSAGGLPDGATDEARAHLHRLDADVRALTTSWERLRVRLDPRNLIPPGRARDATRLRAATTA